MKYLIIGRSGVGKDYAKEILQKRFNWNFVCSYTTRKPRYEGEDTHVFISHEKAGKVPQTEKVAVTHIQNGDSTVDEYFATRKQVQKCDAYIIDPRGAETLMRNMPEENFTIIYIIADKYVRRSMAIKRANGDEAEGKVFDKRNADEDKQFRQFESGLEEYCNYKPKNLLDMKFICNYYDDSFKVNVAALGEERIEFRNLVSIIEDLIRNGFLDKDDDGLVEMPNDSKHLSIEEYAVRCMNDKHIKEKLLNYWLKCKIHLI